MRISDWSSDVCSSDLLRSGSRKTTIFGSPSSKCRSVLNDSPAERFARMEGHDLADPFGNARFPALEGDRAVVQRQAVEARPVLARKALEPVERSEEHTSELQSLMRISYAVFCLKKQNAITTATNSTLIS